MSVYIANLGKYNEGILQGAWFNLPVNIEDVREQIGLDDQYDEYAIHDYELPFDISEYVALDELNQMFYLVEEIEGVIPTEDLKAVLSGFSLSIEELAECLDDISYYGGVEDMEALAEHLVDEGLLGEVPEWLTYYVDYAAIARDMEIEGCFVVGSHGIYEMN